MTPGTAGMGSNFEDAYGPLGPSPLSAALVNFGLSCTEGPKVGTTNYAFITHLPCAA